MTRSDPRTLEERTEVVLGVRDGMASPRVDSRVLEEVTDKSFRPPSESVSPKVGGRRQKGNWDVYVNSFEFGLNK